MTKKRKVQQKEEDSSSVMKNFLSIRKELGHLERQIDIFKVDIEGWEYRVLNELVNEKDGCNIPANMLLLETHLDKNNIQDFIDLFYKLNTICKFEVYYKEKNLYAEQCMEWCFVKIDFNFVTDTYKKWEINGVEV